MATGSDLLLRALRTLGTLGHDQSATADMETLGLSVIQDMLDALPDMLSGPRLFDVTVADGTTVGGNVRLLAVQAGAASVTLPAAPNDGWRVVVVPGGGGAVTLVPGGSRKIAGATSNYAVPANSASLLYRADLADWVLTNITALSATIPYPAAFDQGLAALLAGYLAPHYNVQAGQDVLAQASDATRLLMERYGPRRQLYGGEQRFGDSARG